MDFEHLTFLCTPPLNRFDVYNLKGLPSHDDHRSRKHDLMSVSGQCFYHLADNTMKSKVFLEENTQISFFFCLDRVLKFRKYLVKDLLTRSQDM